MNIIGRLIRDAEVRTVSQDKQVVNFSVAINDGYRNKEGQRIEQTTYFDCAYWINTAVAKILTKGALVELSGRVYARAWTGQDGEAHAGLNFHTSQIKLHAGAGKKQNEEPASAKGKQDEGSEKPGEDDDLPF
jgi:single-strand DNA-binding protein